MKKIIALVMIMSIVMLGKPCYADILDQNDTEYTYFEDGSYFITTISEEDTNILARSTTVTKSKSSTYYNKNNEVLWYVKVTGKFVYGNGTAKCISSSVSAASRNDNWKVSDKSSSISGASATATATGKLYQNNRVINTVKKSVTLSCDSKGKFS